MQGQVRQYSVQALYKFVEEERVQTIEEIEAEKREQIAVLGASDAENCSFSQGYCKRQALYACLTCAKDGQPAAMCLGMSSRY